MRQLPITLVSAAYLAERPWEPGPLHLTVRGAVGRALQEVVCLRPHTRCEPCDLRDSCLITTWFDRARPGENTVRPWALRSARPLLLGGRCQGVHLDLAFFGTLPDVRAVLDAFRRLGRDGLGAGRVPHRLDRLRVMGEGGVWHAVVRQERPRDGWPGPATLADLVRVPEAPRGAVVTLETPTQLDRSCPRPTVGGVLQAAVGRVRGLERLLGLPAGPRWSWPPGDGDWEQVRREDTSRWSARQRAELDLSGWTGRVTLGPAVAVAADLLEAAVWLQVGRNTTAGMGKLRVGWL